MRLNEFMDVMNSIKEVMDNDDVDIVVVGKAGIGSRISGSDLQFNYVNDILFDRENKVVQIYYRQTSIVD